MKVIKVTEILKRYLKWHKNELLSFSLSNGNNLDGVLLLTIIFDNKLNPNKRKIEVEQVSVQNFNTI